MAHHGNGAGRAAVPGAQLFNYVLYLSTKLGGGRPFTTKFLLKKSSVKALKAVWIL